MPRFDFIGPTYTAQSPSISAELCRNWYYQPIESGGGKSRGVYIPTPGQKVFATIPDSSVRGLFFYQGQGATSGRCFAVGKNVYELSSAGVVTTYAPASGTFAYDTNLASITAGPNQLLVASGGFLYVLNLLTGILTAAVSDPTSIIQVGYGDGYFIALRSNSNTIRISSNGDAATWPGAQIIAVSYFPDSIVGMQFEHRELILFGNKQTVIYGDSGSLNIFDPIAGAFLEQGLAAPFARDRADNSAFWAGQDERGALMGWRLNGTIPQRITNHAIEAAWQSYSTTSDLIAFSHQHEGHTFAVFQFPTANKTWAYDIATGFWAERDYWDAANAQSLAHKSQCHCYAFGKHLVGDPTSGNIYQLDSNTFTDNGNLVRRVRRAPYIASEEEWIAHYKLQVLLESGTALQSGQGSNPMISLRWSDDGGHTFSNEYLASAGLVGQYRARAIWRRLGRSRGRVYEVSVSDPIAWRLIDAYLNDSMDGGPVPRMQDQMRKSA